MSRLGSPLVDFSRPQNPSPSGEGPSIFVVSRRTPQHAAAQKQG